MKHVLRPSRSHRAWVWTLVIATSIYGASSIHRLGGGDSGELLAEACVGGNAHPPGYPLLLLLLRTVRLAGGYVCPKVPFVVLANALNASFAAGAAACVAHVVELLVGPGHAFEAVSAGLLFACSPLAWEYALGLEVFALNNLLVGVLLICFVHHGTHPQATASLYTGALVCGLGLANQHTIVLFELPMILWIVSTTRLRLLDWLILTIAFTAGLSPYGYTYHAGQSPTLGSWGDTSTATGLIAHILRREYGTFQLSPIRGPTDNLVARLKFYANDLVNEMSALGCAFAFVGVVASGGSAMASNNGARRRVVRMLLVVLVVYLLVFNSLANLPLSGPLPREVTRRFFLQPNLLIAILVGLGMATIRRRYDLYFKGLVASWILTAGGITLAANQFHRTYHEFTTSAIAHSNLLHDFGLAILHSLPANAVLLSYTDVQWNSVRYLQTCEHVRPDVVHLNLQVMAFPWFQRQHLLYQSLTFPSTLPDVSTERASQGYANYLSRFVHANLRNHKIFLDLHGVDESTITGDQLLFGQLQVLPLGFVWQIVYDTVTSNPSKLVMQLRKYAVHRPQSPRSSLLEECCGIASHINRVRLPRGSWEFVVVAIAHDAMYQRNLAKLGYWLAHGSLESVAQLEHAVVAFDEIQYELNDLVWSGIQKTGGAITYDLYAVEKNAVVSRQRFQLYLEALAELIRQGHSLETHTAILQHLLDRREEFREKAIAQVSAFLVAAEKVQDTDAAALRRGLETLISKRISANKERVVSRGERKKRRKRSCKGGNSVQSG